MGQLNDLEALKSSGIAFLNRAEVTPHNGPATIISRRFGKAGKENGDCAFEIKLDDETLTKYDLTAEIEGTTFSLRKRAATIEVPSAGRWMKPPFLFRAFNEGTTMLDRKFEQRFPSQQNAIDIFRDRWASKIEEVYPGLTSGPGPYFNEDRRPSIAAQYLGFEPGSLQGMNILELGPLEGAHTYQLAKLGANRILAIEANAEAFLKCLVVKEILQTPRCQFLLGDCLKFLQESHDQFDMVFCSGILYHMENPFEMIKAISRHTGRVFLWTHYYDADIPFEPARSPKAVVCDGLELTFYEQAYGDPNYGKFWGGNTPTASWLSRDSIEQCFRHFGYELTVHEDNRGTQIGPHITATAWRKGDGH